MFGTIIGAIIVGAIIGGLARLILPGRQGISVPVTIILGILGSLIASWLVYQGSATTTRTGASSSSPSSRASWSLPGSSSATARSSDASRSTDGHALFARPAGRLPSGSRPVGRERP